MIDGVLITPLRQFLDARGKVMHMLRDTDPHFRGFGEIYFSTVYPQAIKAWLLHTVQINNLAVPWGIVKLVLYDSRAGVETFGKIQEIFLGPENYQLVTIPPGIWYGFQGLGSAMSIVANCSTHPHDPQESQRKDLSSPDIPYKW